MKAYKFFKKCLFKSADSSSVALAFMFARRESKFLSHIPAGLCLLPSAFQAELFPLMGLLEIKNVKEVPSSQTMTVTSHALR